MNSVADTAINAAQHASSATAWLNVWAVPLSAGAAVFSAIAALAAIWISVTQFRAAKEHNIRMVTPHLSSWRDLDDETGSFTITLTNDGIGPAIVKSVTVAIDGAPLTGQGSVLMDQVVSTVVGRYFKNKEFDMFLEGHYVSPQQTLDILHIRSDKYSCGELAKLMGERVRLSISYESILGQKYTYDEFL